MNIERFNKLIHELSIEINISYKDQSRFMNILGNILFFNKRFMDLYVTTLGNTVFYPSKLYLENNATESFLVMCHEYVHMKDNIKYGKILYPAMYLFPQILVLLSTLSVFAFFTPYAWFFLAFLIFALPLPAPGRKYLELRAYKMTLYSLDLHLRENTIPRDKRSKVLMRVVGECNKQFTSSAYYFMWPLGVKDELTAFALDVVNDKIPDDSIYRDIKSAFEKSK